MKKQSRDSRAIILVQFFTQLQAGLMTEEQVIANHNFAPSVFLYDSEVEKLKEKTDAVNLDAEQWDNFVAFLDKFDFIQTPKHKRKSGGGGGGASLPTVEKAQELGIPEADIPTYVNGMKAMYQLKKEVESVLGGKRIAISIPNRKEKEEKVSDSTPTD